MPHLNHKLSVTIREDSRHSYNSEGVAHAFARDLRRLADFIDSTGDFSVNRGSLDRWAYSDIKFKFSRKTF